ncbi:hypothetical protein FOA43_000484 [Brettanomyces nanus]|uniref:Protein HRI1 n=1 Tax=Eeniella nana TaxID=13502 RepID=A0A875RX57_EENNA|nr:uncharacterized protein FOA43_000484 [Brettanomyces nanus]QPG73178.1 hypothetical protein FOA43_000484 [Brettanomyces nanus]
MSASIRLSIFWPNSEPEQLPERTDTLVLTTSSGRYIDIRSYKQNSLDSHPELKSFPFDWAFAGDERVLSKNPTKIEFTHQFFDSSYILRLSSYLRRESSVKPNRDEIPVDCGRFVTLSSGIREETGEMMNEHTKKVEPYIEHWVSVDPLNSKPNNMIQLDDDSTDNVRFKSTLFDIEVEEKYEGRFIRLGAWAQGLIWDKSNIDCPISVIRRHQNGSKWITILQFGDCISKLKGLEEEPVKEGVTTIKDDVRWTCKESN